MLGLREHADLPELGIKILHEGCDSWLQLSEVMILQLLAARRLVAKEGSSGQLQVFPLLIKSLVDQEILLFRSALGGDPLRLGIPEQSEDPD